MTTRAKEPRGDPPVCQNGTVIEQSGMPRPGSLSHSVIHSSDQTFCSPSAGAGVKVGTQRPSKKIAAGRSRLPFIFVAFRDLTEITDPIRLGKGSS